MIKGKAHSEFLLFNFLSPPRSFFRRSASVSYSSTDGEPKREENGLCGYGDGLLDARGGGRVKRVAVLKEEVQKRGRIRHKLLVQ